MSEAQKPLAESFETGPYSFRNPRRVTLASRKGCFACSAGLERARDGEPGFMAIEADCAEDGIARHFHVRCWGSGESGRAYRLRAQRNSESYQWDQDRKRRAEGA